MWRFRTYLMVIFYSWVCEKRYIVVLAGGGAPNTRSHRFSTPMMTPRKALPAFRRRRPSRTSESTSPGGRAGSGVASRRKAVPGRGGKRRFPNDSLTIPLEKCLVPLASSGLWGGTGAQTQRAAIYTFARAGVVIGRARLAAVPSPSHLLGPGTSPAAPLCLSLSLCVCFCGAPRGGGSAL
jgi:hypothetical protein